jgi:hypothetical protein
VKTALKCLAVNCALAISADATATQNALMKTKREIKKMFAYEFECWKCDEWHNGTAETETELKEITELLGVTVRLIKN